MGNSNLSPTPLPDKADMDKLLSFLPKLCRAGFEPVEEWDMSGETLHFPYPRYHPDVTAFINLAGKPVWSDYDYIPMKAYGMLSDPRLVANASLMQVKTMLTYIVRGERFADGHWAAMIEQGHLRRVLERLAKLSEIEDSKD